MRDMRIVERLERLLMDSGVGKRQVRSSIAKVCGISPQAVQQWFSGSTGSPTPENLAAVCKRYRGNLMWVITGAGDMHSDSTLDHDESALVELWRSLPPESKSNIMAYLSTQGIRSRV